MIGRQNSRWRLVAYAAVALVAFLGLADFLPHTDDGCEVEYHCVACRAHLNPTSHQFTAPSLAPLVVSLGRSIPTDEIDLREQAESLLPPGRAPPVHV